MSQIKVSLTDAEEELLKLDCVKNFPEVSPPNAQGWVDHVVYSKVGSLLMEGQLSRLNKLSREEIKEAIDDFEKKPKE